MGDILEWQDQPGLVVHRRVAQGPRGAHAVDGAVRALHERDREESESDHFFFSNFANSARTLSRLTARSVGEDVLLEAYVHEP